MKQINMKSTILGASGTGVFNIWAATLLKKTLISPLLRLRLIKTGKSNACQYRHLLM